MVELKERLDLAVSGRIIEVMFMLTLLTQYYQIGYYLLLLEQTK
jgi:hypothetical protein